MYFFSWKVIWFWQKEFIKVQNSSCSCEISPNLYFDTLLLLKAYKISAKKLYRTYVSWHWRVMQTLKKIQCVAQKWQEFGEFWSKHSKVSKISNLIGTFHAKYKTFDLKKYSGVIFHDIEDFCKFWRKLTCGLENDIRDLANFHQSTENWWALMSSFCQK